MKKNNTIIYGVIAGFLLIGLIAAVVVLVLAIRGASTMTSTVINNATEIVESEEAVHSIPTDEIILSTPIIISTPEQINTSTPVEGHAEETEEAPVPTQTIATPTQAAPVSCGITGETYILLIGQDNNQGEPPFGAEAIRVLRVNFDENKAVLFAFPRELLMSTPHLDQDYGIKSAHLGTVYHYVYQRNGTAANAHSLATNAVAQAIYDNFNIISDHYITLDQNILKAVIDRLGGIEINIPNDLQTTNYTFSSGQETLDGSHAADYLAFSTSADNQWDHQIRQDLVLNALANRLLSPEILPDLAGIYREINGAVITSFSPEEIAAFICIFEQFPIDAIEYQTFSEEMVTIIDNNTITLNDPEAARNFILSEFD